MTIDIDLTIVADWARAQGVGETISDAHPLTGGTQNRVIALRVDGRRLVLRCPPSHPRPSSNRAIQREIALLTSLSGTPVPHPGLVAGCEDLDVLGMVFYLMEEVDGFNPGDDISESYADDAQLRRESGLAVARALAQLGDVNTTDTPMEQFRKPGSFLGRQVDQWQAQLDGYESGGHDIAPLGDAQTTADWLRKNQPADSPLGIMHGDFHLNNVLLAPDRPEVAAIVDWEMSTIGDPLLDLGWLLACWPQEPAPVAAGERLGAAGGLATRRELVEAYDGASTRSVADIDWYTALAGFKLGIVLEGTWVRALAGKAPTDVGERLHRYAVGLVDLAARIASGEWSPTT